MSVPAEKTAKISPIVWRISLISLLTDISSEMLYPILPLYLRLIGFSALGIGLLEGLAEALAGLSKGYFGQRSDAHGERVAYIRSGYLFSSLAKPLLALSAWPAWVFAVRLFDRLGKGLRSAPRDALLASASHADNKALIFGLHRGMDTLGAVLGPLLTLGLLTYWPSQYRLIFLLAFVPALVGVLLTLGLRNPSPVRESPAQSHGWFSYLDYWRQASPDYRHLLATLLLFGFFNSSDAFLLLRCREQGIPESAVLGLYLLYNLLFALTSPLTGLFADRQGLRRPLQLGLLFFGLSYAGFSQPLNLPLAAALFALYALYAACSESIAKAWISQLVPASESGTALGLYLSLNSIMALLASLWTGLLWDLAGASLPLGLSALGALAAGLWLFQKPAKAVLN